MLLLLEYVATPYNIGKQRYGDKLSQAIAEFHSNKKQPELANSNILQFSTGDRVYVIFQSGKKCPATILITGEDQSKIEYNKWCETGWISSKEKGEQEWAPNHALSKR